MKICFFTENYYKGGLDTFIINLVKAWPDSDDNLTLICNDSHPGLETIEEKTASRINCCRYRRFFTGRTAQGKSNIRIYNSFPFRVFFVLAYRIMEYPILIPWYLLTLTFFFRYSDFDRLMVINGGYPASLLCRCAAIAWWLSGKRPPAVFNFHNLTSKPVWYISVPENIVDRLVIKSVANIISVSKACLDTLNYRKSFLGSKKLRFIYNGIEDHPLLDQRNVDTIINKQYKPKQYCLMLATYEPRKGHIYLLNAFKRVVKDFPDVCLYVFGYGKPHEKQRVLNEVKRLGLDNCVILNDFTSNTASLIANASILVVPSQAEESFGLTIIEAMAFGIPVVSTDVGGMPEVLSGSNAGYVCSKDDYIEFADAIKKILNNPIMAAEMGRNGRKTFESKFTASIMSRQYEEIIKKKE